MIYICFSRPSDGMDVSSMPLRVLLKLQLSFDPASHMLVSKIQQCVSQYKLYFWWNCEWLFKTIPPPAAPATPMSSRKERLRIAALAIVERPALQITLSACACHLIAVHSSYHSVKYRYESTSTGNRSGRRLSWTQSPAALVPGQIVHCACL